MARACPCPARHGPSSRTMTWCSRRNRPRQRTRLLERSGREAGPFFWISSASACRLGPAGWRPEESVVLVVPCACGAGMLRRGGVERLAINSRVTRTTRRIWTIRTESASLLPSSSGTCPNSWPLTDVELSQVAFRFIEPNR
jgi:hypothetical protein